MTIRWGKLLLPSPAEEVLRKFFNEMSTFMINQSEARISQRKATRRGGALPYPRYVWETKFHRIFVDARATSSSNRESKSLRIGDWFDFL
jgi:hypothetical protein